MPLWSSDIEALRAEARAVVSAGMPIVREMLGLDDAGPADPVERVRRQRARFEVLYAPVPEAVVRDIAGVRCRILVPDSPPRAVLLHFHGGGMVVGAPEMADAANLDLCRRFDLAVVSVDYRLAPENPYPAAPDDGLAVAGWLVDHAASEFGTGRLMIDGESAGASVGASVLLRMRDELGAVAPVVGACLTYGLYDWGRSPSQRGIRPSTIDDLLDPDGIRYSAACYLPGRTDHERRDPAISPAFADLRGLPPAFLSVGTADHLLDDTLVLATRWAAAGNDVELFVAPDLPHAFTAFPCALTTAWVAARRDWFERTTRA
jgi:acetyl esterase/lipase